MAVTLAGLTFCSSAAAESVTETSRDGQTFAVLSYERESDAPKPVTAPAQAASPSLVRYSNFEVTVSRQGRRLVQERLRATCRQCTIVPGGARRSIRVRDVTGDNEPEVIVDLYTINEGPGYEAQEYAPIESYYNSYVYSYAPEDNGGTGAYLRAEGRFGGKVTYRLRDLERDGDLEFVTEDDRFALDFESSRYPLRIWRIENGRFENVTKRYPRTIAGHARRMWRSYVWLRRAHRPVDGALAVYMADLYLINRSQKGWGQLRRLARPKLRYPNEVGVDERGEEGESWEGYLRFLRQILRRTGYAR